MEDVLYEFSRWLNAYPERSFILAYIMVALQFMVITGVNMSYRRVPKSKRIVYCDGTKSKIIYIRMVTQATFDYICSYSDRIEYPIIDINSSSVYFDVSHGKNRIDRIDNII